LPKFKIKLDVRSRKSGVCTAFRDRHAEMVEREEFDARLFEQVDQFYAAKGEFEAEESLATPRVEHSTEEIVKQAIDKPVLQEAAVCSTAKFELCGTA
jgi:hypothetical protein